MVTKSIAAGGKDRQSLSMPSPDLQSASRNPASSSTNRYRPGKKQRTQKTDQRLIKILICDDAPADRKLIRTCLQGITDREIVLLDAGYTQEIRDALDKRRIDLVLMDGGMTGEPGMEWLGEISKRQLAPVVVLTGSGTEETAARDFQDGAVARLPKSSLSPEKLASVTNLALDKWTRLQQAVADREQLERLVTFDSLTGLYNRQAILGKLRELVSLANRYKEDFSLIMLDIDHFRGINDRYGYLAGDQVLEDIATSIRRNVRDSDIAGRYGGEEFIIILPRTNLSSAWVVAERHRGIIEKTEMRDSAGNVFSVTVSQGLAGWEQSEDPHSLVSRAEEALRKAKHKGRNRVQIMLGPSLRDKL